VFAYTSLANQYKQFDPIKLQSIIGQDTEIKKLHAGYIKARDILLKTNSKLVLKMVHARMRSSNLDKDELIQLGLIGLSMAIDRYNPFSKAKLSTYAHYWILRYLSPCSYRHFNGSISMPLKVKYLIADINRKDKSDNELITAYQISRSFYSQIKSLSPILDQTIYIDVCTNIGSESVLYQIKDARSESDDISESLAEIMNTCLTKLEHAIVSACYLANANVIQKELAFQLGLKPSELIKLKASALKKIEREILKRSRLDLIDPTAYD
jgi:RNA polymerase sigma factor (sigma-70 family)